MTLPTFLIIGAAKAATTTLHDMLGQHPDVFVPALKEPRFFAFEGQEIEPDDPVHRRTVTRLADYEHLFQAGAGARARGEASPAYLTTPGTAERIAARIPQARLIACLRDPAERAWSHFWFAKMKGYEPSGATFEEAIERDTVAISGRLRRRTYLEDGLYARLLDPYLRLFPRDRVLLLRFEDIVSDPLTSAAAVFRFLDVDDRFEPEVPGALARSGEVRNQWVHDLLHRGRGIARAATRWVPRRARRRIRREVDGWNVRKVGMPHAVRSRLVDYYRDDVKRLEGIIQSDLSAWLRVEPSHES